MTYSKKSDCLDANAVPLNIDQLKLLKPSDRLILENIMPDGSKEYTRGILHSGFNPPYSTAFMLIRYELQPNQDHGCKRLPFTYMNPFGRYKNYIEELLIYEDPDLETNRYYSSSLRQSPCVMLKMEGLDHPVAESRAKGLEVVDLRLLQ